jgi:hypothetical protein
LDEEVDVRPLDDLYEAQVLDDADVIPQQLVLADPEVLHGWATNAGVASESADLADLLLGRRSRS